MPEWASKGLKPPVLGQFLPSMSVECPGPGMGETPMTIYGSTASTSVQELEKYIEGSYPVLTTDLLWIEAPLQLGPSPAQDSLSGLPLSLDTIPEVSIQRPETSLPESSEVPSGFTDAQPGSEVSSGVSENLGPILSHSKINVKLILAPPNPLPDDEFERLQGRIRVTSAHWIPLTRQQGTSMDFHRRPATLSQLLPPLQSASAISMTKNFSSETLFVLAKAVKQHNVLCAAHGRVTKAWESVAEDLRGFGVDVSERTLRSKLDALLKWHVDPKNCPKVIRDALEDMTEARNMHEILEGLDNLPHQSRVAAKESESTTTTG
ncbi:hypothetical protein BDR04DRAFT_1123798, partial [Suillus decipiens]